MNDFAISVAIEEVHVTTYQGIAERCRHCGRLTDPTVEAIAHMKTNGQRHEAHLFRGCARCWQPLADRLTFKTRREADSPFHGATVSLHTVMAPDQQP